MTPENDTLDNTEIYHTGKNPQRTLIEVDGDFWDKITTLIDSRLHLFFNKTKSNNPVPTKYKGKKPEEYWKKAVRHCNQIIEKKGYLWAVNFREDRYLAKEFPHPQQFSRVISKLLDANPDLAEFRLKNRIWRFICYKEEEDNIKSTLQRYYDDKRKRR